MVLIGGIWSRFGLVVGMVVVESMGSRGGISDLVISEVVGSIACGRIVVEQSMGSQGGGGCWMVLECWWSCQHVRGC